MTSPGHVVCFGEAMIRLSTEPGVSLEAATELTLYVAGAESNVAITLARLGHPVSWVSSVPANALGRFVVTQIGRHGVNVDGVCWSKKGRVGLYFTELGTKPRSVDVIYDRNDSTFAGCSPDDIDWSRLEGAALLHMTGITPALRPHGRDLFVRAREEASRRNVHVSVDANFRSYLWSKDEACKSLQDLCSGADVFFISWRDIKALFSHLWARDADETDAAQRLRALLDCKLVVVTLGERGASCLNEEGWHHAPALATEIVDPIGRGDAFAGTFLKRWLDGKSTIEALRSGVAAAALAQTFRGDAAWITPEAVEQAERGNQIEVRR